MWSPFLLSTMLTMWNRWSDHYPLLLLRRRAPVAINGSANPSNKRGVGSGTEVPPPGTATGPVFPVCDEKTSATKMKPSVFAAVTSAIVAFATENTRLVPLGARTIFAGCAGDSEYESTGAVPIECPCLRG